MVDSAAFNAAESVLTKVSFSRTFSLGSSSALTCGVVKAAPPAKAPKAVNPLNRYSFLSVEEFSSTWEDSICSITGDFPKKRSKPNCERHDFTQDFPALYIFTRVLRSVSR
ncbi:hypothetical protein DBT46_008010 [Aerococcus mictus]